MSQYIVYSSRTSSGGGGGVSTLNGQSGALTLVPGSNITITPGAGTLTIASTGGGSGTVTSVSVVSANGFAGTVATDTTTPAITLSTTITGLLKGDGTAISAAIPGTDYQPAGSYITALTGDATAAGPGSAALTLATVNGSPGTFGSASSSLTATVSGKGLITALSSQAIQIAESQVTNLVSDLASKQSTALTNSHILVGSASNIATDVAVTGDVTISNSGVTAIGANKVANSQLTQMAANTIKGNNTGSTANALDLTTVQVHNMLTQAPTVNKFVYVSQYGSDVTGDGTFDLPFATTAAAYTAIGATASTTNRYGIHIRGTVVETNIYLKPFCWFYGDTWGSSRLSASSGNITLDPTAFTSGNSRCGMTNVYLTGSTGINLDFVAVSASGSHVVEMDHLGINGSVTMNPNNVNQYFQWEGGGLLFGNFTQHGAEGLIVDLFIAGNVVVDQSATAVNHNGLNFQNCFMGGSLSVSSTGAFANPVQLTASTVSSTLTVSGTNCVLTADSISLPLKAQITLSSGGTISRTSDVYGVAYVPTTSANWTTVPTNAQEALDYLAARTNATEYYVNNFTLSGADITNQFVTLSNAPDTATKTVLQVIGGPVQDYGVDYSISGTTLTFLGSLATGGSAALVAGDKLIVQFN